MRSRRGARAGVLDRRHRSLTVGVLLAMSIVAFEGLALTTVAPVLARELDGVGLYGRIFSASLLPRLVAPVVAGDWADPTWPSPFRAAPLQA